MSTIQERQKGRKAQLNKRLAAAAPKQNTRKFIYRIFKNYTPKKNRGRFHRATNNEKSKNVIWDLAGNPGDKQFKNLAEARYTFLNSKNIQTLTDSEVEEYNTLKLLLEKYNKKRNELNTLKRLVLTEEGIGQYNSTHDPLPFMPPRPSGLDPKPARAAAAAAKASANAAAAALPASGIARKAPPPFGSAAAARTAAAAKAAPAAASLSAAPAAASAPASSAAAASSAAPSNSGNPTPPVPGAPPSNLTAGDPQSIDDTIKKMRCTVCESQKIISGALGTTPRSCNNCGAVAPAVASSAPAAAAAAASSSLHPNINNTVAHPGFPPPAPLNASAAAPSQVNLILGRPKGAIRRPPSAAVTPLTAVEAAGQDFRSQRQDLLGGRSSRRRHRKTSRRTKNKRSTRRR